MDLDKTPSGGSDEGDSENLFGQSPPEASRQPTPAETSPQAIPAAAAAGPESTSRPNDAAPVESSSAAFLERQRIKSEAVYAQIHNLNQTDAKLAKLLQLASQAMEAAHPTHREQGGDPGSMWSHETTAQEAKAKADEYYALLNGNLYDLKEIQLDLRHTIRALRRSKISVLPVTQSQHQMSAAFHGLANNVAPGAVHPASVADGQASGLGLGATRMQSQAWRDLKESLQEVLSGMDGGDVTKDMRPPSPPPPQQQQSNEMEE